MHDQQLVPLLAHAEDDAGLGEPVRRHAPGARQQLERAVVASAGPGQPVEPLGGLEVVVQDVGPRPSITMPERPLGALEVGDQHLDRGVRQPPRGSR